MRSSVHDRAVDLAIELMPSADASWLMPIARLTNRRPGWCGSPGLFQGGGAPPASLGPRPVFKEQEQEPGSLVSHLSTKSDQP